MSLVSSCSTAATQGIFFIEGQRRWWLNRELFRHLLPVTQLTIIPFQFGMEHKKCEDHFPPVQSWFKSQLDIVGYIAKYHDISMMIMNIYGYIHDIYIIPPLQAKGLMACRDVGRTSPRAGVEKSWWEHLHRKQCVFPFKSIKDKGFHGFLKMFPHTNRLLKIIWKKLIH